MVASASYLSEDRFYVVERCLMDWWFVRKTITREQGFVKCDILVTPEEYTLTLPRNLDEQIESLPVVTAEAELSVVLQPPMFAETMEEVIKIKAGESVSFTCRAIGIPTPEITWFRQSTRIESSNRYQITTTEDNISTLVIRRVSLEDAGTYKVVAKNHLGFCSYSTQLSII